MFYQYSAFYMSNFKTKKSFFKLRYDCCRGNCNLSNCKWTWKNFREFDRICTHDMCVNAAVLYHLRYGEWYIGSRSNCWVHLNQWKEWYMKSNTKKYDHVTPALKNRRLLPVKANLYFREAVMALSVWWAWPQNI